MPKPFGFQFDLVPAIVPVDLSTAANDGDWISLKGCEGLVIIVFKGAGTAGEDPVMYIEQASDVSGTGAKVLNAVNEIFTKQGTLTAVGTWTRTTQTLDDHFDGDGTSAESQGLYVVQIEADQLDVDNGFDCVRVRIDDVGANAQIGCALYLRYGLRYPARADQLLSAIVN